MNEIDFLIDEIVEIYGKGWNKILRARLDRLVEAVKARSKKEADANGK